MTHQGADWSSSMRRPTSYLAPALPRARQARLPSPWTEAVDFLCFPQSRAPQCSTFLLARAPRSRKSTASGQGEGSEVDTETARMFIPLPYPHASGVMFASGYTGVQAMAAL